MRLIKLTQEKCAVVSDKDYKTLINYKWFALKSDKMDGYYVAARKLADDSMVYMHRQILNAPEGFEVDHRNGNGLDNRRHNIRVVTRAQNRWNSKRRKDNKSGVKGVSWHSTNKMWVANIKVNKKLHHLGSFESIELAIRARKSAEKRYHGRYAYDEKLRGKDNDR